MVHSPLHKINIFQSREEELLGIRNALNSLAQQIGQNLEDSGFRRKAKMSGFKKVRGVSFC